MKLGEVDSSGRRRPEKIEGSEFSSDFDTIVAAIGQAPQVPQHIGIEAGKGGTIPADWDTLATEIDGVFAGGDVVSGPASVIEAIAAGRQAAVSIDKYLGGQGVIDGEPATPETTAPPQREDEGEEEHRSEMALLPADKRINSFDLVELGLSAEGAAREARRCWSCDLEED